MAARQRQSRRQSASEPAAHEIAIDPLGATPLLDEGRGRTPYMLRDTAATLLIERGAGIQRLLGIPALWPAAGRSDTAVR
jgi:integrase